jgi:hypothetical protein
MRETPKLGPRRLATAAARFLRLMRCLRHGSGAVTGIYLDMVLHRVRAGLRSLPFICCAWMAACVSDDSGPGTDDGPASTETGGPSCGTADDCDACLAIAGCNWNGSSCDETCLADASCYGPGNPAAPTCPDLSTTGGECGALGDGCIEAECCEGLTCSGSLAPTCVDPDQCLPDGAECAESSECCEGRVCDGEEVLQCTLPVEACIEEGEPCVEGGVACCAAVMLYCEPELELCVLQPK